MSVTKGGTALKPLQQRRQLFRIGRLGGNFNHLADCPLAVLATVLAIPHPDGGRKVFQGDDHADESEGLLGIVRGPKFEHHLLLRAQVNFLQMAALVQIPDVQFVAVLSGQQQLRVDTVLHHVRRAPFGGDHGVVPEVPPEVIGQTLRAVDPFPRVPSAQRCWHPSGRCRRGRRRWPNRARCRRCRRGRNEWCVATCSLSS